MRCGAVSYVGCSPWGLLPSTLTGARVLFFKDREPKLVFPFTKKETHEKLEA